MDSCLVLTQWLSRRILRFRTSAIDLIRYKSVSFDVFFLCPPSGILFTCIHNNAKVLVPSIWDSFPVFWAFAQKISQFNITYYIEIACHYIWIHGAYRNCESEQLQGGGSWGKTLKVGVTANLLCNSRFWKQQNGYSYRKCMATPYIEKYVGILFWTDFWFKMLLTFKASMPLLANLKFRNGRFLVSAGSTTLTALNSLFEEISKIIPWSRGPGDPTSAKCKVKVDSYKACIRFNGRE